ncbi:TadE/TadG family type IV pilus assembly protein [Marivivens donghaensis]|uniref:TadE/TadG family type IV pilus assembly protein n=1 Tax=Marivivens donghaensis TaxID=1699413 RepID=UPI003F69A744
MSHIFRRFRDDERGSMAIETVLIFPILCWAYLATFVYFDAFRIQSTTNKAAYTISDQVSRETGYITPNYMTSLYNLHEFLTSSNHPTKLRLSVVRYTDDNGYDVRWSQGRGGAGALTNAGLADILDKLPVMPNNEVIIVVQNWLSYEPMFSVGLSAFEFENLIVTRPRFNSAQLCWNSQENGGVTTATC